LIGGDSRSWQKLPQRRHHHQRINERVHAIKDPTAPGREETTTLVWRKEDASHGASLPFLRNA